MTQIVDDTLELPRMTMHKTGKFFGTKMHYVKLLIVTVTIRNNGQ